MSQLTPEDEALLTRARSGLDATDADRERVRSKLFAQLGIGGGGAIAATKTSAAATTLLAGSTAKIAFVVSVAALVVGGTVALRATQASSRTNVQPTSTINVAAPASAQAPAVSVDTSAQSSSPTPSLAEAPTTAVNSIATAPAATSVGPAAPRENAHVDHPSSMPSPTTTAQTTNTEPTSTSTAAGNTTGPVGRAPSTSPTSVSTSTSDETLTSEVALLQSADAALKQGQPDRALAILDRYQTQFPHGSLAEEQEAERVVVLCALGRTAEARIQAQSFLTNRPRSPLAGRVRASCGGTP